MVSGTCAWQVKLYVILLVHAGNIRALSTCDLLHDKSYIHNCPVALTVWTTGQVLVLCTLCLSDRLMLLLYTVTLSLCLLLKLNDEVILLHFISYGMVSSYGVLK